MELRHISLNEDFRAEKFKKMTFTCNSGDEMSRVMLGIKSQVDKSKASATVHWTTTHHQVHLYFDDPKFETYFRLLS